MPEIGGCGERACPPPLPTFHQGSSDSLQLVNSSLTLPQRECVASEASEYCSDSGSSACTESKELGNE